MLVIGGLAIAGALIYGLVYKPLKGAEEAIGGAFNALAGGVGQLAADVGNIPASIVNAAETVNGATLQLAQSTNPTVQTPFGNTTNLSPSNNVFIPTVFSGNAFTPTGGFVPIVGGAQGAAQQKLAQNVQSATLGAVPAGGMRTTLFGAIPINAQQVFQRQAIAQEVAAGNAAFTPSGAGYSTTRQAQAQAAAYASGNLRAIFASRNIYQSNAYNGSR